MHLAWPCQLTRGIQMRDLFSDLAYTMRQLRRSPGFALTTILTLTMAITANVVVFGIANALLLHPLPVPQPRQLFMIEDDSISVSYPNYRDIRDRNIAFSSVALERVARIGIGVNGVAQPVWGYETSGNYFETLGVQPLLGRFFGPSDDVAVNGSPVAVLSYACWKSRFNGDPQIVGKTIQVSKHPYTVVGVAPKNFTGSERFIWPEIWVPAHNQPEIEGYDSLERRGDSNSWVVGRVKAGVTQSAAESDLKRVAAQLAQSYPKEDGKIDFHLAQIGLLGDMLGGPVHGFLVGVMALAFLVLLAACANLGALFSSRMADRARELSIRLAIGSSRARILRQILTESTAIALTGGMLASLASYLLLDGLTKWRPPFGDFPIQFFVEPDWTVFLFAILLTLGTGVLFGLIPARQIWKADPNTTLRASGNSVTATRSRLRSTLLVIQIALCCLLVTSSLVAFRGLQRTFTMPLGFRPEGVVRAAFDVHLAGYGKDQQSAIQQRLRDAVAAIPGVSAAAYSNTLPLDLNHSTESIYAPGTTEFNSSTMRFEATYYEVSPNYFTVAGTKLLAGREFNVHDTLGQPRVAIVNRTFARRLFGTEDVIGKRYPWDVGKETEIVGLVEDGKYQTLTEAPEPVIFWSILQSAESDTTLLIKSQRDPQEMAAAMRHAIAQVDSGIPVFNVQSWNDALLIATFPARAATVALGVLGALAIMLAITGIFGLANYTVSQSLREFGIRVALGAKGLDVLKAAIGGTVVLLAIGSVGGLLLGFAASRLLASIVYQASASDPVVIVAVVAAMALLGFISSALPARRALKVDPAVLLREQ